jgi:beta-alanine degradation protein BauB
MCVLEYLVVNNNARLTLVDLPLRSDGENLLHVTIALFFVTAILICAAQTAAAQDPVKVDPDHYKVLYENNAVRILEYHDSPGHKVPKHSHPNYFVYVISDATRLFTNWNSVTACNGEGNPVALKADESLVKPPVTHCEQNIGNSDTRLVVVEFKAKSTKAGRSRAKRRR